MNNAGGELCLPQEDPGEERHPLNRSREQGGEALEGEDMSSTSFTLQLFKSPKSFYRTFSGSLRNISEEHKEFLYNHLRKLPTNVYFTGFSPHTEVEIIHSRLLVGIFNKQSCLILGMELDRRYAEVGLINIICKPNTRNEDQQQKDPPFHLVENVVNNCQLHGLNDIDSYFLRGKWQLLFQKREENSLLQDRKENSLLQDKKKNKGAIAGVFKDDILINFFYVGTPIYKTKEKETNIHYEEVIFRQINAYFQNKPQEPHNGTQKCGKMEILIYTPKSPCFKREKETIVPCFFQLLESAALWQKKYNCRTYVGFTDYYGPIGSRSLDKWDILRNSVFYPYTEKSENVSVKLDWKKIQKKIDEMKKVKKFQKIRNLNTDFKKCFKKLENLAEYEQKLSQHLIDGKKIITSSGFDPAVKDEICEALCTIWEEAIENKRLELIKENFQADYNKRFVKFFLKHQSFSSRDDSLQLCLIEKQHLPTNMLQSDCHSLDDKNVCSRKDCETVNSDQTGHL